MKYKFDVSRGIFIQAYLDVRISGYPIANRGIFRGIWIYPELTSIGKRLSGSWASARAGPFVLGLVHCIVGTGPLAVGFVQRYVSWPGSWFVLPGRTTDWPFAQIEGKHKVNNTKVELLISAKNDEYLVNN